MRSDSILAILTISFILASCASTQSRLEKKREKDPQYQYEKAVVAMNYGFVDEAIRYANQALSLNPNHQPSWHLLGLAYEKKQNFSEAAAALQKSLELKPDFSEGHMSLGIVYEEMNILDKAEEEYRKAFVLDRSYKASFNLARVYFGQDKLDLALKYVQKSIEKDKLSLQAFNLQGVILNKLGRYPEAIGSFQTALKIDPNYAVASINLAVAYINSKSFDKARELLEKTLPQVQDQKLKEKILEYLEKLKEIKNKT